MPSNVVKNAHDEALWKRAKAAAAKQGKVKNYALIMHIYQSMKGEKSMIDLLRGEDTLSKANPQDAQERLKYQRAAKRHRRLAEDHRRAGSVGGNTMSRWRQERAHEDAQEAHQEAAEADEEAVSNESARTDADEANENANTHPGADEVTKCGKPHKGRAAMESSMSKSQGGPFTGPRGGLWADAQHTIPYKATGTDSRAKRKKSHKAHAIHHQRQALEATNAGNSAQAGAHMVAADAHGAAARSGKGEHSYRAEQLTERAGKTQSAAQLKEAQVKSKAHRADQAKHEAFAENLRSARNYVLAGDLGIKSAVESLAHDHDIAARTHRNAAERYDKLHDPVNTKNVSDSARDFSMDLRGRGNKRAPKPPMSFDPTKELTTKDHGHAKEYHRKAREHHNDVAAHSLGEGNEKAALLHGLAARLHGDAEDYHDSRHDDAGYYSRLAVSASRGAEHPDPVRKAALDLDEEMDKLMKAAKAGAIIGRTADGKEVYAHGGDDPQNPGDPLKKKQAKPAAKKPAAKKAPEEDEEQAQGAAQGEEGEGPGTHDHHAQRALAHLQAAQAHASAAHSAKKVEEAKEHKGVVNQAEQMSQAAMADTKKPQGSISKGILHVNLDAEQEYLDILEKGGVGVQGNEHRYDGRSRLMGMRGERLSKSEMSGGTIYEGENSGQRGGDLRENWVRAQSLQEVIELDDAGHHGSGGLPEWFRDAPELVPEAQAGVRRPAQAVAKGLSDDEPIQIIDDSDPYTRAVIQGGQHGEHQSAIRMFAQGRDRNEPK